MESHHSAEPRSVKETLSGPNAREWIDTMKDEKESMRTNQDWDLVVLPIRHKAIGNKWVLKIKRKADGFINYV